MITLPLIGSISEPRCIIPRFGCWQIGCIQSLKLTGRNIFSKVLAIFCQWDSDMIFYSVSSTVCIPASLNEDCPAFRAQAGDKKIAELVKSAIKHHSTNLEPSLITFNPARSKDQDGLFSVVPCKYH